MKLEGTRKETRLWSSHVNVQIEENVRGREVQRGRLRIRPIPADHVGHNLDSEDSGSEDDRRSEDNHRIEQFFDIQEQRFLNRWDNFSKRFHQLREMRALEDLEFIDVHSPVFGNAAIGEQPGAINGRRTSSNSSLTGR